MSSVLGGGKMEGWGVSKMKSWLLLLIVMMVCGIEGCIEEERNALLLIKTSLLVPYVRSSPLISWVDDDGGECCDWERVKCNTTTGHITHLSLTNIIGSKYSLYVECQEINWPLNVSLFLHFKELTSLNLSMNCLGDGIVNTGLGRLSSLKKLETLDLSWNSITNETFPSLGALTSLRVLNLGHNDELEGYFPALDLENLEILDLSRNYEMQGFEQISLLKKLKILNLRGCSFKNESFITSLSALPMLKSLDLSDSDLFGTSFPGEELINLKNLEMLDLSWNKFNGTPSIQECMILERWKKLKSITLQYNNFNTRIISCLSALPSLKILDLSGNHLGSSFPIQELSYLPRDLEVLILRGIRFNGTLPMEAFTSFYRLEVLDLSDNQFVGSIPSTINTLLPSSIRAVSFAGNMLNGSLLAFSSFHHLEILDLSNNQFDGSIPSTLSPSIRFISFAYNKLNGSLLGLCELKNLHELDLVGNMLDGNLPECFNRLSSLKLLDISSNQITGTLPSSVIANLTSLEYVDFSDNIFEGAFSFSSFSSHTNLEVVRFISNNNKFEMETEEPKGWIPMFQLRLLVLSGCNINRLKGSVVPGFLLHQRMLQIIDLSHNSLVEQFPNRLIENKTILEVLILRNNSFGGTICMPLHTNPNLLWLDMSENHIIGTIPGDIQKFFPYLWYLNLSKNSFDGFIPSSIGDLSGLFMLDLSDNELSGEVPNGFLTNSSFLNVLKLSNNLLHGMVLSGNISFGGDFSRLALDNNCFTGKIGNKIIDFESMDISNNFFTGTIPHWISNISYGFELVARNNSLEGPFPCGKTPFSFLDISQNSFSGPIPSCLNFQDIEHLHLGSNKFTGSVPDAFRSLTGALTLDIGNNSLSGRIPEFLGNLSNLRILILRENNFSGSIPMQLCQLTSVSLIDLSSNYLSGSIPSCLQNITTPYYGAFEPSEQESDEVTPTYTYQSVLDKNIDLSHHHWSTLFATQDEVHFTTKALFLAYKGSILDYMVGLDLSDNKLTGEIPNELGFLTEIHSLNLSHNQLSGPIPINFSNLANIESLDLSSNNLSGEIPSQLIKLNSLAVFNVSYNNLSGRLPDMKAQFSTFTDESYQGNPLLCGLPLEKKCTPTSPVTDPSTKEATKDGSDKWYDIDMVSFYGSSGATWVVFLLGFVGVLYINPYWRRRWLDFVEECMYTCCYFLDDLVRKLSMLFRK